MTPDQQRIKRFLQTFYDRFKKERSAFLTLINGIADQRDREWYASLMLNRLMFLYFIQKKGFLDTTCTNVLDGDPDYLRNRLKMTQQQNGKDTLHSFYRHFLLKLFHEGLNKREHSPELERLIGKVPYLNGSLFDIHVLERDNLDIQIPDEAFERIFNFFDEFNWYLDDRPLHSSNEINPNILGYIFEKYINQKQMGAYYTKEDVTEYISKNAIIPHLFEAAERKCHIAFTPDGPVWSLLRDNPDDYIYEAMAKGTNLPLPCNIEAGIHDVAKRTAWNKPASEDYALPTEIWREVVTRRTRYEEVRAKIVAGEITSINDLITYNLDICKFARDLITYSEGPALLLAFYESIEQVTVLDPTCGSGAFLFAALNILRPLYEACLMRMQVMVTEHEQLDQAIAPQHHKQSYHIQRFRAILREVDRHHSRAYFILKSIIINNLYGVDIMEEAIEICKLRLFLKLITQIEKPDDIEPLPDINFNVLMGNALLGLTSPEEIHKEDAPRDVAASLVGVVCPALPKFDAQPYQPFHWCVAFHRIMNKGGFDVIIGNPPYMEISDTKEQYTLRGLDLARTGNLYSVCIEKFIKLLSQQGHIGVIIPISSISTPRMLPLMQLLSDHLRLHISNFAVRPGKLFVGTDMNLTILVGTKKHPQDGTVVFSTDYNRWHEESREFLFSTLNYSPTTFVSSRGAYPKLGTRTAFSLHEKIAQYGSFTRFMTKTDSVSVYYHSGGRYFRKCLRKKLSNEYKELKVAKGVDDVAICLLSSSFYYWLWIALSDCYHVMKGDIDMLPVPDSLLADPQVKELAVRLLTDLEKHAQVRIRKRADNSQTEEINYYVGKSKPIIDEIDRMLAKHYGFTDEELDFIINYDIKYRMGRDNGEENTR